MILFALAMTLTGFDDEDDDIVDCSECKVVLSYSVAICSPLAFKSISGAKILESLICDARPSLAVVDVDVAVGNDVELLILPAPSGS